MQIYSWVIGIITNGFFLVIIWIHSQVATQLSDPPHVLLIFPHWSRRWWGVPQNDAQMGSKSMLSEWSSNQKNDQWCTFCTSYYDLSIVWPRNFFVDRYDHVKHLKTLLDVLKYSQKNFHDPQSHSIISQKSIFLSSIWAPYWNGNQTHNDSIKIGVSLRFES